MNRTIPIIIFCLLFTVSASAGEPAPAWPAPVDVRAYGAVGNGVADDTAAIQAAIDATTGTVLFPKGTYRTTGTITISTSGVVLSGAGSRSIIKHVVDGDAVVFSPSDPADPNIFISGNGIIDLTITSDVARNGSALKLVKVDGFTARNFHASYHKHGLYFKGGRASRFTDFRLGYSGSTGPEADASMLKIEAQEKAGGGYTQPWTTIFSDFVIGGNFTAGAAIEINAADGFLFSNAYIGGSYESLVKIKNTAKGVNTVALFFDNIYFDGIAAANGTIHGMSLEEDGLALTTIGRILISNSFFGNFGKTNSKGIRILESEVTEITITGTHFANIKDNAIEIRSAEARVNLAGCIFRDVATASSGGSGVSVSAAASINISASTFASIDFMNNSAIFFQGAIGQASVSGCTFSNNTNDISNSATFTGEYKQTGNTTDNATKIPDRTGATSTIQTVAGTDTGDVSASAITLLPTSDYVQVTCHDTDGGCVLALSETGMAAGRVVEIECMTANITTIRDAAGVQELAGQKAFRCGALDLISLRYNGSRWVERWRKQN
jgi:hypothetical protein